MPVGGAQPPNAVVGGIMATVFAVASGLDVNAALGAAIPFALLGQYGVTLTFTLMSGLMAKADEHAANANPKGIDNLNYFAMALLGLFFAVATLVGVISITNPAVSEFINGLEGNWIMGGLSAAGGMMRYVGFAVLMRIMLADDMWGIYFAGFALAAILGAAGLGGPALVLVAFVGIAIALYDYNINVAIKNAGGAGGGNDGI